MNHDIFISIMKIIFGIGFSFALYGVIAGYFELYRIWRMKGFNPFMVILNAHNYDEDVKAFRKRHFKRFKNVALIMLILVFILIGYIEFR